MMRSDEIRELFLEFFKKRGHVEVRSSSLIPEDPSVLLTAAGMQQFKNYFVGQGDPEKDFGSKNVVSVQKCFRTSDIDEAGDESHLTFFEMLGNFSFSGYGKVEAIKYAHELITQELNLEINYVTVFAGDEQTPADQESAEVWRKIDPALEIKKAGRADNFWGPTGNKGPCGPTTEIYVRGVEIWNLVFNEYFCHSGGKLEKLSELGIDTGMGLERLAMVVQKTPTIFETDLFAPLLASLPPNLAEKSKRIVADHERAASFLIADGVLPSNKGAGYVLRRLIRRSVLYGVEGLAVAERVIALYGDFYPELKAQRAEIFRVLTDERQGFARTLAQGAKELNKLSSIDAPKAFWLYETYGLPLELIRERFPQIDRRDFEAEFQKHQQVSRVGSSQKFAGGLADHEPATIRLHTAHHLLLAALQRVLGPQVKQRGSNINQERLRLDFSHRDKLSVEQKKQVEAMVNEKIKEDLSVVRKEMPREEAEKLGAEREFGQKYGERVSVYFIQDGPDNIFSKEFCGGPHVSRTGELGHFRIISEEAVAAGVRRIKAVLML